ncbi:MAG TPA: hypothetical protein VLJ86_23545 [Ramlibacter sp.]|nr:hypothetical protein [Ramlibacter sp.]
MTTHTASESALGNGANVGTSPDTLASAPKLADCELFPQDAIFNTRIDDAARFPAHAKSAGWIASVGGGVPFRADWGRSEDPTQRSAYYGIPINAVNGAAATTEWANLRYDFSTAGLSGMVGWPHESDCAVANGGGADMVRGCSTVPADQRRFPIPTQNAKFEGGTCNDPSSCGDRHLLVVESGACRLWESYSTYQLGGQWYGLATAAWDMKSLALRPKGWTAADASGLPMTPFLAKATEVAQGEIRHALRVTFRDAVVAREFVWPARHGAGGDTPGGIPFGALLRLRSDFVIPSDWSAQARTIATAAKQYGLYVADIGMDFYVQGEPSVAWEASTFAQLATIPLSQMEFVDMGAVTGDPRFSEDSMAARWR